MVFRIIKQAQLEGRSLSYQEYLAKFKYQCQRSQDLGKLGAAIVVLLAGQGVNTAIKAATNALDNNSGIYKTIRAKYAVLIADDIYNSYHKELKNKPVKSVLKSENNNTIVKLNKKIIKINLMILSYNLKD